MLCNVKDSKLASGIQAAIPYRAALRSIIQSPTLWVDVANCSDDTAHLRQSDCVDCVEATNILAAVLWDRTVQMGAVAWYTLLMDKNSLKECKSGRTLVGMNTWNMLSEAKR